MLIDGRNRIASERRGAVVFQGMVAQGYMLVYYFTTVIYYVRPFMDYILGPTLRSIFASVGQFDYTCGAISGINVAVRAISVN